MQILSTLLLLAVSHAQTDLPTPFDDTPPSAFRLDGDDSCSDFMQALLSSADFNACHPVSMMLQTSSSFFQAEKSLLGITSVLDASCSPPPSCLPILSRASRDILAHCRHELQQNHTLALQAYRGLAAYPTLYAATCLRDDQDQYCFARAVTDVDNPDGSYLYFLPLGMALPADARPPCDACTAGTMSLYRAAAEDDEALIAGTYPGAAGVLNRRCGGGFVDDILPSAASRLSSYAPLLMAALGVAFAS